MTTVRQDITDLEELIDQYYKEIESPDQTMESGNKSEVGQSMESHEDIMEKEKKCKVGQNTEGQQSTPLKSKIKQNSISDFFKIVTTPDSSLPRKRKIISPIGEEIVSEELGDVEEINAESTVTNISCKLDAFKETFELNMEAGLINFKTDLLGELDKFKDNIIQTIQEKCTKTDQKLKDFEEKVDNLEKSLEFQDQEIEELKKDNVKLRQKCQIYEGQIARNDRDIQFIKEDILQMQAKSMSANLVFYNIPELERETDDTTADVLRTFMQDELKIQEPDLTGILFDRVHRFGKKLNGKSRAIIARFAPYKGKEIVLRHAKNLDKSKKFVISEQLPAELHDRKQRLMPVYHKARRESKKSKWVVDKLLVEGNMFTAHKDNVSNVNTGVIEKAIEMKVKSTPPKTHLKSTFQGHAVNISCQDDIIPALNAVRADPRIARAEHNIYAYRLDQKDGILEHYDDDREWGAGRNILTLLKQKNIVNKLIVVTRWFGGSHIGPVRFQLIKDVAGQALQFQ